MQLLHLFAEQSQIFSSHLGEVKLLGSTPVSLSPSPFIQILFIPKPRHHIQNYFIRINYKGFYPANKDGLLRNFQCNLALSLKRQSLKFQSRQIKILSFMYSFMYLFFKTQILQQGFFTSAWPSLSWKYFIDHISESRWS